MTFRAGFKNSGIGRDKGEECLENFTQVRYCLLHSKKDNTCIADTWQHVFGMGTGNLARSSAQRPALVNGQLAWGSEKKTTIPFPVFWNGMLLLLCRPRRFTSPSRRPRGCKMATAGVLLALAYNTRPRPEEWRDCAWPPVALLDASAPIEVQDGRIDSSRRRVLRSKYNAVCYVPAGSSR